MNTIHTLRLKLRKTTLCVVASVLATLAACTSGGRIKGELPRIDSLTETDQRAAIARIDSIKHSYGGRMGRSDEMRLALLRAKAANKLGMPLSRDSLRLLDGYFNDNGTHNERMLIKYIIGCSYLNDKDAPSALKRFHEAAGCADTTDTSCDWRTLHKVHAQAGLLLYLQNALYDAKEEYKQAFQYALKAKDTLNALITIEQKANIYMSENKTDSAIMLRKRLYTLYIKHGFIENAALSLGPIVDDLAKTGKLDVAKRYLDNYEKSGGLFDSLGNIEKGREIHYYIKGVYFLEAGKLDSAEYLFRKCIKSAERTTTIQTAFKGLARLYKQLNRPDSVAKYAELVNALQDSAYNKDVAQHLQQMQAMYNYELHEQRANEAENKSAGIKTICISITAILLLVIITMTIHIEKRKKLRIKEMPNPGKNTDEYGKPQEGQQLETAPTINESTKNTGQHEIEKPFDPQGKQPMFTDEPIIRQLNTHLKKDMKCMTTKECVRLKELFDNFEPLRHWENKLNDNEYIMCLLAKTGFSPKDISTLMGLSQPNVSNMRKRLFEKMAGKSGSAKDFDKFIIDL